MQARLSIGGRTRRIPLARPTAGIPFPHITQSFHGALAAKGEVVSLEPFMIAVVNSRSRVVEMLRQQ